MKLRQQKSFTHHDRNIRDDFIKPNTNVYVFQSRCTKFQLPWDGPFVLSREEHPSYIFKITRNGIEEHKWFTRKKLRRCQTINRSYKNVSSNGKENDADED